MEIICYLLEQSEDMLSQWRSASNAQIRYLHIICQLFVFLCVRSCKMQHTPFSSASRIILSGSENCLQNRFKPISKYDIVNIRCGIVQSMNSDGGRCHDNARCEAMWARMKEELLYGRYDTKKMTIEELKTLIWRYFIIYWNNRRICSANGGLPPMLKRKQYYESLGQAA